MRFFLFSLLLLSTGCATMFSGTHQIVRIDSEEPGIDIRVNGRKYKTPAVVHLKRDLVHHITFPNDVLVIVSPSPHGNGVVVLNAFWFFFGILPGFIALLVDESSGASCVLDPTHLYYKKGFVFDHQKRRLLNGKPLQASIPEEDQEQPKKE
ncbi:MAG: hypothetical protein ACYTHM_16830 [Planctomycetota bacterium]|jgi:hypothetical protein